MRRAKAAWAVFRSLYRDERGIALILVAASLTALIGFAALGTEAGLWYLQKRYDQSAADMAALSGAMDLADEQTYSDICSVARLAAWKANAFPLDPNISACPSQSPGCVDPTSGQMCVNNPPILGNYASDTKAVEVILGRQQDTFLASLFLQSVMIKTRAVAGLLQYGSCMIALNQSGVDLTLGGGGNAATNLNLDKCSYIGNSTGARSITANGGVIMTAAAIQTAGGTKVSGTSNYIAPPITTGAARITDPYAGQITVPTGLTSYTCQSISSNTTLVPGLYTCGTKTNLAPITILGGTTYLCAGVYVLSGEDNQNRALYIDNTGTTVYVGAPGTTYNGVTCPTTENGNTIPTGSDAGVTIIATCSSNGCGGGFVVGTSNGGTSNQPTVRLNAPCQSTKCNPLPGIPPDILFYQVGGQTPDRKGVTVLASSNARLDGVIYTPGDPAGAANSGQIALSGSPRFGSCTELIAGSFSINGAASMTTPGCGAKDQLASTIALLE